jgi:hypothetical protein
MELRLAVVSGETGIIASRGGRPYAVLVFLVRDGLVRAIYVVADVLKLAHVRVPG